MSKFTTTVGYGSQLYVKKGSRKIGYVQPSNQTGWTAILTQIRIDVAQAGYKSICLGQSYASAEAACAALAEAFEKQGYEFAR